jgi:hypothetical protein
MFQSFEMSGSNDWNDWNGRLGIFRFSRLNVVSGILSIGERQDITTNHIIVFLHRKKTASQSEFFLSRHKHPFGKLFSGGYEGCRRYVSASDHRVPPNHGCAASAGTATGRQYGAARC